ncbi:ion transporter [Variovorax sp. ZT4R33]|uniref:ion transporter n=1 Tax=Variovorax sp. ZT4R33 TaxID=3443743 RepID=UPI003F46E0FF
MPPHPLPRPPNPPVSVADETPVEARFGKPEGGWRLRLYAVIFESETRAGRLFDLALIAVILLSVLVVVLDSVQPIHARWGKAFGLGEWFFTVVFTIEYIARLACLKRPLRYAMSFYGVVDLLALLPTYLAILMPELAVLIDVRILRLLRVFRIFKMSRYAAEYRALATALAASRRKIMVFVGFVIMVVLVLGTLMYVVEGPQHGFTSIPVAVYWAISTMTTVGFGDLVPKTGVGRAIASVMMLLGWGVLAVPTGIVSAEMVRYGRDAAPDLVGGHGLLAEALHVTPDARRCADCGAGQHAGDARFCRCCGHALG